MIELIDGLPLVRFEGGRLRAFRRDWLLCSILRAAAQAGYHDWWLAEHVAESVTSYLRLRYEENVVALPRLEKAVQSVLQVIGYSEVGLRFEADPPIAQLSLHEVARDCGGGFELFFFDLLRRRIAEICGDNPRYIELLGLHPCVKLLRGRKIWSRDCGFLQEEIVCFVRKQLSSVRSKHGIVFALS